MKVLFNNIGNRHLKYPFIGKDKNGNPIEKNLFNEKNEFKKITQFLLENFDKEKENISLEILRQYLEQKKENQELPDKIVLFGTNQENITENENFTNQDTYWAALIIQKYIQEKYNIPVEVIQIEQNPSDENSLFPVYYENLKNHYENNPGDQWIFLDAGGTPQQKLVCKLLMPEINKNTQIDYLANVEGIKEQDLREKSTEQLEKFFIKKNVKSLIEKGHYQSAYELLRKNDRKQPALPFIKIGALRMRNLHKNIESEFNRNDRNNPVPLQYLKKRACINFNELRINLDEFDYYLYGEYLARSYFYFENRFNEQFILSFQQSTEVLCINFLWYHAKEEGINIDKNKDGITYFLEKKFNEERSDLSIQLKTILKIAEENKLKNITELFNLLANINNCYHQHVLKNQGIGTGLDTLRNKIVHEAKPVETIPRNIRQAFEKLIDLVQLEKNTFKQLNEEINKRLF